MDALDGPIAAPHHHTVVFENEHVRVLETVIAAIDSAPLHSHLAKHLMLVNSGSHYVRRDADGTLLLDTRSIEPPFVMPSMLWSDGNPAHTLQNTGDDEIRITAVELKG
jgi:hypothetical protein